MCGLEAHTEEDLKLFVDSYSSLYGRGNSCKKCARKLERVRTGTLKLIAILQSRSPDGLIRCHFCEEPITRLEGRASESLHIHSLDGNHKNWDPANKVPSHHRCHNIHHHLGKFHAV